MDSPASPLSVAVRWDAGEAVIALSGDLDYLTAPYAAGRVGEVLDRRPARLVLDLAGVSFIDSYGLNVMRVIIRARQALDFEDRLILRSPAEGIRRVLQLTGMDRLCVIDGGGRPPADQGGPGGPPMPR